MARNKKRGKIKTVLFLGFFGLAVFGGYKLYQANENSGKPVNKAAGKVVKAVKAAKKEMVK